MTAIGPLMPDFAGTELSVEDREVLSHPLVGGVILFARNFVDPTQLGALCRELQSLKKPRLLIAVDHEGGRVQRFRMGFTRIPAMGSLGRLYLESPVQARMQAKECGQTIGRELGEYGIDLCFAPVLDRDLGISNVIGDRAFSGQVNIIDVLASAFCAGLREAGMAATGKHFPGHGTVAADSHLELPVDRRSLERVVEEDLPPFKTQIDAGLESVMVAHISFPAVDGQPASLSRAWIRRLLREQWRYNGAVFSDDLSMGGVQMAGSLLERAQRALEADNDMLIVCNDRKGVSELLGTLKPGPRPLASARLNKLYRKDSPRG